MLSLLTVLSEERVKTTYVRSHRRHENQFNLDAFLNKTFSKVNYTHGGYGDIPEDPLNSTDPWERWVHFSWGKEEEKNEENKFDLGGFLNKTFSKVNFTHGGHGDIPEDPLNSTDPWDRWAHFSWGKEEENKFDFGEFVNKTMKKVNVTTGGFGDIGETIANKTKSWGRWIDFKWAGEEEQPQETRHHQHRHLPRTHKKLPCKRRIPKKQRTAIEEIPENKLKLSKYSRVTLRKSIKKARKQDTTESEYETF